MNIKSERLEVLLSELKDAGHKVGLHPTYDSWNDSELLEEQKKTLEESLGSKVTSCRQHWLRFSWKDTWLQSSLPVLIKILLLCLMIDQVLEIVVLQIGNLGIKLITRLIQITCTTSVLWIHIFLIIMISISLKEMIT